MGYVIEPVDKIVSYPTTEKFCCILGVIEIDKECYGSCHHKIRINNCIVGLWSRKAINLLFILSGRWCAIWH